MVIDWETAAPPPDECDTERKPAEKPEKGDLSLGNQRITRIIASRGRCGATDARQAVQ
jgi:hypothetical protein